MNREQILNKLPMSLLAGGVIAGVAGFADTWAARNGHDLGLRNALPEPFDIADHGMSWAAGAVSAGLHYSRSEKHAYNHAATANDPTIDPTERREEISRSRREIAGGVAAGITAAAVYVVLGEVGSEVLHFLGDKVQASAEAASTESTGLGHFDSVDILYGIIPAIAITKLSARKANRHISAVETQIPQPRARAKTKSSSPSSKPGQPKANKRYTPPKNKR